MGKQHFQPSLATTGDHLQPGALSGAYAPICPEMPPFVRATSNPAADLRGTPKNAWLGFTLLPVEGARGNLRAPRR